MYRDLVDRHRSLFGSARQDVRVVSAPCRICPVGAHVDHQLGLVTGLALDAGIRLACTPNRDGLVRLRSLNFPGDVEFGLSGIPPMAGFVSKVFIFSAAWSQGLSWLVVIALINTVISLVYYGRLVKVMYFDAPLKEDHLTTPIGLSSSIALTTAALIVITFAAQVVLLIANPAANSLLAFLPGR